MRRIFSSKRGEVEKTVLPPLLETLIPLAIVLLGLLWFIASLASSTWQARQSLATSYALDLDLLPASAGNYMLLDRPFWADQKTNLSMLFDKNFVKVYDKSNEAQSAIYYYLPDSRFEYVLSDLKYKNRPVVPKIAKTGNKIVVSDAAEHAMTDLNQLFCPALKVQLKSVILDPGHGWNDAEAKREKEAGGNAADIAKSGGDKGAVASFGYESEIARRIAGFAQQARPLLLKSSTRSLVIDENLDLAGRISKIESGSADAVISIHLGSNPDKAQFNIKAYYNAYGARSSDSAKLACEIVNSLSQNIMSVQTSNAKNTFFVTGTAVVPVNPDQLLPDDPMQVLVKDKIGVFLEIGNIQQPGSVLETSQAVIASAVAEAVDRA
jgi:N-acetylmuramoyl-L-alanine amidase